MANESPFQSTARDVFGPLMEQYGFTEQPADREWDFSIASPTVRIDVSLGRGEIDCGITRLDTGDLFDADRVARCNHPWAREHICATKPMRDSNREVIDDLRYHLIAVQTLLIKYCEPVLRGDLEMLDNMPEEDKRLAIKIRELRAEQSRRMKG